jgi:hypothetical protein
MTTTTNNNKKSLTAFIVYIFYFIFYRTKDIKVEAGSKIIGGGLGLLTTKDIPKVNSVMLQIPTALTFSVSTSDLESNLSTEQYFINKAKTYRSSPWFTKLSLDVFICDKVSSLRNEDSNDSIEMRPWLDSLPRDFNTPIHWTQDQRQQLQYTPLESMISAQEKSYTKLYSDLHKDIVPGSKLASVGWTYDDFLWGCDVAKSRAFSGTYGGSAFDPKPYALTLVLVVAYVGLGLGSIEQASNGAALVFCGSILRDFVAPKLFKNKKYIICPMIDMANHVGINEEGNVAFEYFGDGYSLSTTKEMQKSKEVRISYGPRSNDVLLQQYGFVEPDNVHDVYVMPPLREWDIQALEVACGREFQPGRLEKLDRAGLLGGSSLSVVSDNELELYQEGSSNRGRGVVITRAGGIDPAIMTALRVLVSSNDEWSECGEAVGNFVTENAGGKENERLARLAAQKALELELDSKDTTLDEDEELLKKMYDNKAGWSNDDRLAVQFRIEKKKVLKETIFSFSLM